MLRFFESTREFRSAVSSVCSRSLFQKCWFLMRQHFWFCNSCIASIASKQSFIVKHTHAHFSLLVCTTPFKTVEYIHLLNAQYAFPMAFLQAWQHLLRVGFKQTHETTFTTYPLVICCIAIENWTWPSRNSGFTQLENSGSFHRFLYVYRRVSKSTAPLRDPTQRGRRCFGPQGISGAQGDGCGPRSKDGEKWWWNMKKCG